MDLNGILATEAGVVAEFQAAGLEIIDGVRGQREVPERFFRRDAEQTDMAGFWSSRSTDPLHPEVNSIVAISETDNLVEGKFGANVGELCPVAADVGSEGLFRKDMTAGVGAENADGDCDLLAGLATLCPSLEQPRYVQKVGEILRINRLE